MMDCQLLADAVTDIGSMALVWALPPMTATCDRHFPLAFSFPICKARVLK